MNHKYIRPFGLRWHRMLEWFRDVRSEKPGIGEWLMMTRMAIRAFFSPISHKSYLRRLLICKRCPIFNPILKNCRKGDKGCGCYVPFKALARVDCWAREQDGKSGWGIAELN